MCRECFYFCVVVVKSALFPRRTNNLSYLGACVPMAEWERVGKDRVRRRVSNAIFSLLGCCFCFAWASACRLRSLSGPWHVHFTISWLFSFFFVLHSTAAGGLNRLFLPLRLLPRSTHIWRRFALCPCTAFKIALLRFSIYQSAAMTQKPARYECGSACVCVCLSRVFLLTPWLLTLIRIAI